MRTILLIICVAFLSGAIYAPVVNACMICVPYPKTTFADVLNEKASVVFARQKTDEPYFFCAVEILKGAIDGDDFKAYIYSNDRRRLSKNLKDVAVFGKKDSADKRWIFGVGTFLGDRPGVGQRNACATLIRSVGANQAADRYLCLKGHQRQGGQFWPA